LPANSCLPEQEIGMILPLRAQHGCGMLLVSNMARRGTRVLLIAAGHE